MNDNFYRAFEDVYRGSRELIKGRLEAYLPFVQPLFKHYPRALTLDLGCGRGEWIELLSSIGFDAHGVDLDEGMLQACRDLGLQAKKGDALSALRALPDGSVAVVSAFHLVEHIAFDDLRELVTQSLRVLKPGGLLIMETPNPENIVVAGCNFYLDPSHQKPIPPILLEFLAGHVGFQRAKIVRLQESPVLHQQGIRISLVDVFQGVSPDYAVVAQKAGHEQIVADTAFAFAKEYGLTLSSLADRHSRQVDQSLHRLEAKVALAEKNVGMFEERFRQTRADTEQLARQLQAVYTSSSWKVTMPLRALGRLGRQAKRYLKACIRMLLSAGMRGGERTPVLRGLVHALQERMPRLKRIAASPIQFAQPIVHVPTRVSSEELPIEIGQLSPDARKLYEELRVALASKVSNKGSD